MHPQHDEEQMLYAERVQRLLALSRTYLGLKPQGASPWVPARENMLWTERVERNVAALGRSRRDV